ncbi:MAG TPA: hypothetical protein DHV22_16950 [Xanthomarina gelatinilytica]|uniref:Uncharacterized protein n=1 Tax=Xanthomarina gelatinilytica TaxID=1137281 RepID=A0A3D6BV84_9FLAO|nr:hypothetical protein [Xanthomarina gelatinilytica]
MINNKPVTVSDSFSIDGFEIFEVTESQDYNELPVAATSEPQDEMEYYENEFFNDPSETL